MTATDTTPRADLQWLPLAEIRPHPDNPRKEFGDVDGLTASVRDVGVLEPLIVVPPSGRSRKHLLIAGHRRLRAAAAAGLTEVPCVVRRDLQTRQAQVEAILAENGHRADLSPVEEGDGYQLLLDLGVAVEDLPARVARPKARVAERLRLAHLPDPARAAVTAHQITIEQGLALAEFQDDPKTLKALMKKVGKPNFQWDLDSARRARDEQTALEKAIALWAKAGLTPLDEQPKGSRPLRQLMPECPYRQGDRDAVRWEAKHHKDCPGRALWLVPNQYGSRVATLQLGCTSPKLHQTRKQPALSPQEKAARAELDARRAQAESEVDIATMGRRAAVRAALESPLPADQLAQVVTLLATDILQRYALVSDSEALDRLHVAAAWFGLADDAQAVIDRALDIPATDSFPKARREALDAVTTLIVDHVAGLSPARALAALAVLQLGIAGEEELCDPALHPLWSEHPNPNFARFMPNLGRWVELVTALGHTWSDVEASYRWRQWVRSSDGTQTSVRFAVSQQKGTVVVPDVEVGDES